MLPVIEYDKNDSGTWPNKEKDGDFVLCKTDTTKLMGIYPYLVMSTKELKPTDAIVAWMPIPELLRNFDKSKTRRYFGNRDLDFIKSSDDCVYGDACCVDGVMYIFDGEKWQHAEHNALDHDRNMTDEKRCDELLKIHLDIIRDEERELREIIAYGLGLKKECIAIPEWLVILIAVVGVLVGFYVRGLLA